ncbi:unnamed protein product [Effrenium voratum]|uniref:Uncharacterized protein n=1 Tax=Effrenium voratum TaxID=2562239 RepID=A0AA36IL42_9DINO|nr:unnamed protein product [Effrenium voratum]
MDNSEEAEGACRLCSQQFGADDRALRLLLVRKFSVSCTVKQNTSGSLRFANSRHLPASGCPCWKLYGSHQGEAGLYRLQCLLLCFEGLLQWREAARAFHCTYHPRHGERKASCLQLDASRLTKNFNPDSAWDFCSHTLVVRRVAPLCFSHSPLWRLRFDKLRKEKTAERCAFPSRKPKHEKCDIKQLIRRAEEEYVDFQEINVLVGLREFCASEQHNPKQLKFRSNAERKRWVRDTLKLKLVKNPATGEESVPVHDKTVMLSGNRRSAARVREESCADRQTAKEEFKQAREGMQVKEAMEEAAAAAEGACPSSDSSGSDNESASSKSSFKVKSASRPPSPQPAKRRRGPGGPKAAAKPASKKQSPAAQSEKTKKGAKAASGTPDVIGIGQKHLDSLAELTPHVVFKSLVRSAEVDRRLGKSAAILRDLGSKIPEDRADLVQEAESLTLRIQTATDEIAATKEVARLARQSSPKELAEQVCSGKELKEAIKTSSAMLLADRNVTRDLAQQIAKKLVDEEAPCLHFEAFEFSTNPEIGRDERCSDVVKLSQVETPSLLFDFLNLKDSGRCSVSLAWLLECYPVAEDKPAFATQLLHAQVAAVGECVFEKLRLPKSIAFAKAVLPDSLRRDDFEDEAKWLPDPSKEPVDISKKHVEDGFCLSVVRDLQKLHACLLVADGAGKLDTKVNAYLCTVAKATFSQSLTLPTAAQAEWRQGGLPFKACALISDECFAYLPLCWRSLWQKVLSAGKAAAEAKLSVKDVDSLAALVEAVARYSASELADATEEKLLALQTQASKLVPLEELAAHLSTRGMEKEAAKLTAARDQLNEWASDILCPEFKEKLGQIKSWADGVLVVPNLEEATFQTLAEHFDPAALAAATAGLHASDHSFALKCFIRGNVVLSNVSDAHKALAEWLALSRDWPPSWVDSASLEELLAKAVTFCTEGLLLFGEDGDKPVEASSELELVSFVWMSVRDMLARLLKISKAKAVVSLVSGSITEMKSWMPREWHALQMRWGPELEKLDASGGELNFVFIRNFFAEKLAVFEASNFAISPELAADQSPFLQELQKSCSSYRATFIKHLGRAIDLAKGNLAPATSFLDKYGEVLTCSESWQMKPVEWVFKEENERNIRSDLKQASVCRRSLLESRGPLLSLARKTGCEQLQVVQSQAKETSDKIKEVCHHVSKLALAMIVAHCLLVGTAGKEEIDSMFKFVTESFDIGKDSLPSKMLKLISALEKQGQDKKKEKKPHKDAHPVKRARKSK